MIIRSCDHTFEERSSIPTRRALHVIIDIDHPRLAAGDAGGWAGFVMNAISRAVVVGFKPSLHGEEFQCIRLIYVGIARPKGP